MFVDGPTGVGKDYFINNFIDVYCQVHPTHGIKIIRAASVVLKGQNKSEERKYTTYTTEQDKLPSIYTGHQRLLEAVKSSLSTPTPPRLIIVNRSFLAFLHYNLATFPQDVQQHYVESYIKDFSATLAGVPSLLLRVDLQVGDSFRKVIDRVHSRQDDKPVESSWLETIYARYRVTPPRLTAIFNKHAVITSSQHSKVIRDYF